MLELVPLFSGLNEQDLLKLESGATVRSYPRNTIIIHQGDESNNLYVILEGRVKVFLGSEDGREIILDFLETDEAFGEMALIDGERRSASVMTTEESRIAMLPQRHFIECLRGHPDISINLMRTLSGRIRSMAGQVENLALLDVYGRIARELMKQSEQMPDGRRITKVITHQDLANLVGSSREMVTKILNDLKRGGYIDIENHRIIICNQLPARW